MKKILIALLILAMMVSCAAFAETEITVSDNGSIFKPADTATINLGVSETADTAIEAQSLVNEKIAAIRTACINAGVSDKNISVSAVNLSSNYDDYSSVSATGYNAYSSLAIQVPDVETIGSIIDVSISAGANRITDISFSLKDPSVYNEEIINNACANARAKAELYAQSLGLTITGIKSVNEVYYGAYESSAANFAAKDSTSTDVGVNTVEINASVTITFTAE